ncbi:MAG: hypothetical protein II751_05770, partial [Bacteroidales bacterium]|nr:hypothetical protein [Bacteroidales bacterium]
MRLKISNIRIPVSAHPNVKNEVCRKFRIDGQDIEDFRILRQAIDARKKPRVLYDYQVEVVVPDRYSHLLDHPDIVACEPPAAMEYGQWTDEYRPIIVGFGPAGMFAALYLARCNARPIILERGERIEERKRSLNQFLFNKELNPNSNVQFGEGG